MNMVVKCHQCGKEFLKSYSEITRMIKQKWIHHFCNVKCLSEYGSSIRKIKIKAQIEEYYKNPKRCPNCNSIITYKNSATYCSVRCAALYTQKDGGHCKWSDEDKKRLSDLAKKNPKFCGWNKGTTKLLTKICIICNNSFTGKATLLKNRIGVCSKNCSRKHQSKNLLNQYKTGKCVYGGTTKWLKYKDVKVQGSYEYRTCLILDKWKELNKIKNWEYTKDRFEYIGVDNKKHNYLIDFKIWNNDDTFYYLEVKGYQKENDALKWQSVRNKGFNLEIWFNKDIKDKEFMVFVA